MLDGQSKCEWCEAENVDLEVHHVRRLRDLKGKALWERAMIGRRRKTMVLCTACHDLLHAGKAVQFYVSHLTAEDGGSYLPHAFLSTMKSIVSESTRRICNILFKLAVELAMLMNVIAAAHKIDRGTLDRLRGECVKEVKRTNGNFTLDDAVEWQEGDR